MTTEVKEIRLGKNEVIHKISMGPNKTAYLCNDSEYATINEGVAVIHFSYEDALKLVALFENAQGENSHEQDY